MEGRKKRKLWLVVLLVLLVLCMFPVCTFAMESNSVVVYDAKEIRPFKDRTLQEVADRYSAARYAGETYSDNSSTWYSIPASTKAPYAAGVLTEDTHKAMTAMTNFYRWLVGVSELKVNSQHSNSLQAQALDRNFEFNHIISQSSKPADMDQKLWDEGFSCTHNILARFSTPRSAITSWINEGYSLKYQQWDTIGHRYALIGADVSDIQFGYSGFIAVGEIMDSQNTMETPYAAFPAPGYMPTNLISTTGSSWSVELNNSMLKVTDSSDVLVTVTDLSNGEVYYRSEEKGTAEVSNWLINFVQPSASEQYSGEYSVKITGLSDVSTGKKAEIRYVVNFVDITEYSASYIEDTLSEFSNYIIYQNMADDLEKIAAILPRKITAVAENGATAVVPVSALWEVDKENSCFVNSADASKLPAHLKDKNKLLERITIPYKLSSDGYDAFNSLNITPSTAKKGENVEFSVYRTLTSTNTSQIFQLKKNKDGTWSASLKFDSSSSSEFDEKQSAEEWPCHIYNHKATEEDSGEYISIYYDMSEDWGGTSAYVSTSTEKLTVETQEDTNDDIDIGDLPFNDINSKYWYYDTVKQAYQLGLMTGTTDTTFEPDKPMSRGMVATVLYRMAGAPDVKYQSVFSDVSKTAYYAQAVTWAYQNKIISGYGNGKFGPDDNVTREEMAVMLCNYARHRGMNVNSNQNLKTFVDYKNITSYAVPSIKWVVQQKIISGTEDGKLNPTLNATRAECAKMLLQSYRVIQ